MLHYNRGKSILCQVFYYLKEKGPTHMYAGPWLLILGSTIE